MFGSKQSSTSVGWVEVGVTKGLIEGFWVGPNVSGDLVGGEEEASGDLLGDVLGLSDTGCDVIG